MSSQYSEFLDAVQMCDFKKVKHFLMNTSIDPSDRDNEAIQVASENGNFLMVDYLLEDPRVDPNQGLCSLAKIDENIDPNVRMAILERILDDPRTDPSVSDNYAIIFAARHGIVKLVDRLLQDPRVDPSAKNNRAILDAWSFDEYNAYGENHISVILRLLEDERVDPKRLQQAMFEDIFEDISRECELGELEHINEGHLRIIKYLSTDSRADPSMVMLFTLYRTDMTPDEKLSVISSLSNIDPSILDNKAINYASFMGYIDIVNFLMKDSRVDPSISLSFGSPISRASERGHLSVVKRLLQDPRVDPSNHENWAIHCALEYGHVEIIDCLLKDRRADPNVAIDSIYFMYNQNLVKQLHSFERILQDSRVILQSKTIVRLLSLYNHEKHIHDNHIRHINTIIIHIFQNYYSKLFAFNKDSVCKFFSDDITENMSNKTFKHLKKIFKMLVKDTEDMIVNKCKLIKEDLMIKAWHPKRIEKLILAGYDIEDI